MFSWVISQLYKVELRAHHTAFNKLYMKQMSVFIYEHGSHMLVVMIQNIEIQLMP